MSRAASDRWPISHGVWCCALAPRPDSTDMFAAKGQSSRVRLSETGYRHAAGPPQRSSLRLLQYCRAVESQSHRPVRIRGISSRFVDRLLEAPRKTGPRAVQFQRSWRSSSILNMTAPLRRRPKKIRPPPWDRRMNLDIQACRLYLPVNATMALPFPDPGPASHSATSGPATAASSHVPKGRAVLDQKQRQKLDSG